MSPRLLVLSLFLAALAIQPPAAVDPALFLAAHCLDCHGAGSQGLYEIRGLAQAMHRHHPYDRDIFLMDPEEPFRLGIVPGDRSAGTLHHPQPIEPQLAEVTIRDGEPEWHRMTVRLEKGQTPRFSRAGERCGGPRRCRRCRDRPGNVPPIDPDIRGASSIRQILAQHRDSPACHECHRKIVPPGFALENFDPIGAWRTHYPKTGRSAPPTDASGELGGGESFRDVAGLKLLLLARQDLFQRALATKLLSCACDRHMEVLNRPPVDEILNALAQRKGGFRDLGELVVLSPLFRSP